MHVVIVEDYPAIARSLERELRAILGERIESVRIVSELGRARQALESVPADLLLLDLNLAGADGFDALPWAAAQGAHTIVVSANTQRAIEAFEHGVLDFIPKPVDPERLRVALERYDGRSARPETAAVRLSVRGRKGLELVAVADVRQIRGAGKYSELLLADGRSLIHDKTLERLEGLLPEEFLRVHRSHIVNLGYARRFDVQRGGKYRLELDDGSHVPVGRSRYASVRERLGSTGCGR